MRSASPLPLLSAAAAIGVASPAHAADPTLPGALAVGGAVRADPQSLTSIATSPAMMAMDRRYSLDLAGRFGSQRELTGQAAISDSMTSRVALGLLFAYNRTIPERPPASELPGWKLPDEDLESRRHRLSVGGGIAGAWLDRKLALGANVFYHHTSTTYQEGGGVVDLGASLGLRLADPVVLAVVAENVVPHADFDDAPARVGGGLRWTPDGRSGMEVDLLSDLDAAGGPALVVNTGARAWVAEKYELAAGYSHEAGPGRNLITAGLGAGNAQGVLRYTFAAPVGVETFSSQHAVGLRIDF